MLYREIKKCRICGHENLAPIINLGEQTLTGVFPLENEVIESGPLELVKCFHQDHNKSCGLVQLRHDYKMTSLYGDNYGYRSGLNQSMVNHLQDIVNKIEKRLTLKAGDLVIDIASNDGSLLAAYKNKDLDFLGVDPTAKKFKQYYPSYVEILADFFSASKVKARRGEKKAKVITSIAMFYDLPEPLLVMQEISNLLDADGLWVVEQSYLPSMIKNTSYDTICHEHLEFYALKQFKWMADHAGLKIIDIEFNKTNGASFCLTLSKQDSKYEEATSDISQILKIEDSEGFNALEIYNEFACQVEAHRSALRNLIQDIKAKGQKILGYGASTKGNVILQYCGLNKNDLEAIADVNADKFGRYTPGTKISIISEADAKSLKPDYFLVLPWHFKDNILEREKSLRQDGVKFIFPLPNIEII